MTLVKKSIRDDLKQVFSQMSLFDKLLPLLIILAMIIGILLSVYVPKAKDAFSAKGSQNKLTDVSIPLLIGLIVMMIPPLCQIQYEKLLRTSNYRTLASHRYINDIVISLVINWIVGPLVMFGLAWAVLFNEPEYRTGVIMIGMARCIAMVVLWNQLALGSNELCALLVIINSVLQIVLYAPYQVFFCYVITGEKLDTNGNVVSMSKLFLLVLKNIGVFLGIPLAAAIMIRMIGLWALGKERYSKKFMPWISPWALIGLIYTIIVIFISKGDSFVHEIHVSLKCIIPLCIYFIIMWFGTFYALRYFTSYTGLHRYLKLKQRASGDELGSEQGNEQGNEHGNEEDYSDNDAESTRLLCGCEEKLTAEQVSTHKIKRRLHCNANYSRTITHAFTSGSNNFELSLAMAIAIYGEGSQQAIAAVFGPLIEVPVLLLLTFVARYFRVAYIWEDVDNKREKEEARDVVETECQ
ncbi:arsenicals resistance [Lodderomyces elongisporus]|uniref:Arsenical-resistance protein ACR3 n=1 Tax=Lodderomyces elongisporus (strain ATCC 11503 / CBS 2605 / JCM 1781 / NBRC 1676 / NRRL YB-4239) TaxID=379508 RepID=A5E5H3_LODEL|nr:arsenicals resistance [Lodderomyces elongisporus]EDK46681.1 arsenical-resistance protein ACR3 [Lodderomyces elongisporus NRRL YB-4239]WLF81783.1 arsenicals resistance [Lodderomyces elongisporus]